MREKFIQFNIMNRCYTYVKYSSGQEFVGWIPTNRKPLLLGACSDAGMCVHGQAGCICDVDPTTGTVERSYATPMHEIRDDRV